MSDFQRQLEELRVGSGGPPGLAEARLRFVAVAEEVARLALGVGDRAPGFALPDALGRTVRLDDVLPAAIQFYRGGW